ncbi:DUF2345 domain-containing protein [Bosea sp. (in: a-proteobacteria)]|uniref:DUF2345 domain-containing protein n=1 Tax=Bosea sp. (in: a-proteobacteria) TaxID=1871050 RepID=UPI0027327BD2|nr:DUF2345 domain-containing protein [Bosea sp. (in: a-proteobacteria)]MDP3255996.1 DUF2345 domain-containing protein [Bosea sp. (in: a-proteobacteria)]
MAADSDALERRIAKLESQLAALTAMISATPGGALAITAPGGVSITAGGALSLTAGGALSLVVGSQLNAVVGSTATVSAGTRIRLMGGQEIALDSRQCHVQASVDLSLSSDQSFAIEAARDLTIATGKKLSVTAADEATLKSGGAQLELKKDGSVTLRGRDITTSASGRVTVKSSANTVIKGSKIGQN